MRNSELQDFMNDEKEKSQQEENLVRYFSDLDETKNYVKQINNEKRRSQLQLSNFKYALVLRIDLSILGHTYHVYNFMNFLLNKKRKRTIPSCEVTRRRVFKDKRIDGYIDEVRKCEFIFIKL